MTILNCVNSDTGLHFSQIVPWLISIGLAVWNFIQLQKIETLKTNLQKKLNVHKIQFEKEFEIYKEISYQLNTLRDKIVLRPKMSYGEPGLTYEQQKNKKVNEAVVEANRLIDITEANRPFYSEDIYQQLKTINTLIKKEIIDVSYGDKTEKGYWSEGVQTVNTYIDLIEKVSDLIRRRIGNMNEI